MSVVKSKQDESDVLFLENARKLELFTLQKVVHFPKRYTFYLSQPIYAQAQAIHNRVKSGNSIYPTNQHEAQMRRDEFLLAKAGLHSFVSMVGVARETFHIAENIMTEWMGMIHREISLINGELESAEKRYQRLPG